MLVVLALSPRARAETRGCRRVVIDGEVRAGEGFSRQIGNGLAVGLEPLPSGWILRVAPVAGRGAHDYAELATPPYESVNPLLVSTDFSFRAQDAVGWNPRRFRFAASAASFERLNEAYQRLRGTGEHRFGQPFTGPAAAEAELAKQVSEAAEGRLEILDARLVAGTADQAATAAAVASHFTTTAHLVEQSLDGRSSPLGRITWLRFRIVLEIPGGFRVNPRLRTETAACARNKAELATTK